MLIVLKVVMNLREGSFCVETPTMSSAGEISAAALALVGLKEQMTRGVLFESYVVTVTGETVVLTHGDVLGESPNHTEGYRRAVLVLRDKVSFQLASLQMS